MKKLPIGIQNFEKLVTGDFVYVDKTEYIYKLITEGTVYFLSRPRRFGKSLLISTLENIFKARKELFRGLYIYDKWEFREYPVIRIDMISIYKDTPEEFKKSLFTKVKTIAEDYDIEIESDNYHEGFSELIRKLSDREKVVILIDEYDKPIIDFLTKPDIALDNRDILKNFYGILKATDEYTKFVLLTGVSKFSRTSIFSDLNNLYDITMVDRYNSILGYDGSDIDKYFGEYISKTSKTIGVPEYEFKKKLQSWYNGYRFSEINERVYNPFSVLHLFANNKFGNYWFESGTPTFLVNLMREKNYRLSDIENLILTDDSFSKFDIERLNINTLLFQTGYLTIDRVIGEYTERRYKLYYPNLEVKHSLLNHLLKEFIWDLNGTSDIKLLKLKEYLRDKNIDEFFEVIKNIIAGIPYEILVNKEDYYNSLMYTILSITGINANFEIMTNTGRLDCALELNETIYIFEFKLDTDPQKCIEQIKDKKYYEKYKTRNKEINLIGVNISTRAKNIDRWLTEKI